MEFNDFSSIDLNNIPKEYSETSKKIIQEMIGIESDVCLKELKKNINKFELKKEISKNIDKTQKKKLNKYCPEMKKNKSDIENIDDLKKSHELYLRDQKCNYIRKMLIFIFF